MAKGRHSEKIPYGATENAGFMLTYNGIWAPFCNKTAQAIAKTSTSSQLSVSDMLTHVNLSISPWRTLAMAADTLLSLIYEQQ